MSFFIGNIEIKNKVILAPMAGITSFSYRKFINNFYKTLSYTEMVSDCGLIYGNNETKRIMYTDGTEFPLTLQLFGGKKENLIKAIEMLEESGAQYDILDINLACPVNKVIKSGAGSYLLQDLDNLYDLMSSVVKASSKPVSAKIRLGYNDINVINIAKTLENAGVKFLAIHARTRKELYSGSPHYEELKELKNIIKIPFCISGNIFTVEDAKKALEITKADAVMVARGSIGNPELLINIDRALNGLDYDDKLDIDRQINYLKLYSKLMINEFGEKRTCSLLKGIAPKFFVSFPNSKKIRTMLTQINSIEDLNYILDNYNLLTSSM